MSNVLQSTFDDGVLRGTVLVARLDAATARNFKAELEAAWRPDVKRVELDLGTVDFMDSSGVGALISSYRKLGAVPGSMRVNGAKPAVRSLLDLLRLNDFFQQSA